MNRSLLKPHNMVDVCESHSPDCFSPITDESDNLETPLQIWERWYASGKDGASNQGKQGDVLTIRKPQSKRRTRRRLNSRETMKESSSDDDFVVKRKLRSKVKSSKVEPRLPASRKRSKKMSTILSLKGTPSTAMHCDEESTALDDIFFKPLSSKKKPAPSRSQKKATGSC